MALRTVRQPSWDSIHSSDASQDVQASMEDDTETMRQPRIRTIQDVHDVIHPLRATADRVGKEVERFAESLDRLANSKSQYEDCRKVLPIVRDYEKIATETVARLRRYHEPERQEKLKGAWKRKVEKARTPTPSIRGRTGDNTGTTVEDLENWEQERQTWQLLRLLLQCQYPAPEDIRPLPDQETKYQRPVSESEVHPFSSEYDVWTTFLGKYADVWEKHVIVEWLKSNAESNGPSIGVVIEELDEAADRGQGLSAHGWLYSKEAIKAQKRLRGWPQPLDSNPRETGLMNKDKTKSLVTQLDPDAFSRQGRSIETEDAYFERAAWLGCWEMMRRGESWQAIRSFCQERVEGWRALSIRGDPRSPESNKKGLDIHSGPRSRTLWRKMCEKAAKDGGIDDYESGVYGLLSGNYEAVEKIARGWDDHLFALYNSQVLQQFDYYISKSFPESLPASIDEKGGRMFLSQDKPSVLSGQEAWESLLSHEKTKTEARSPIKMIQGSLIARLFEKYVYQQGLALGRSISGSADKTRRLMRGTSAEPVELGASADVTVEDYDILRILTHIILIFTDMKALKGGSVATENIIFAYVSFLANAGKFELLPLYAAKLSKEAGIELMARQLHLISNPSDQKTIIGLMKQYDLDTNEILRRHLLFLAERITQKSSAQGFPSLDLIGQIKKGSFDMPTIRRGFLPRNVSPSEYDLIHAVEWYLAVDGAWDETIWAATLTYKTFLRAGSFAAAAELAEKIPVELISKVKTRAILGTQVDITNWTSESDDDLNREIRIMGQKSDTLQGLENLMWAVIWLENWTETFEGFKLNDPKHRADLQAAHRQVVENTERLLSNWLQMPIDDDEKAELETIRVTYLPDVVLSYISVLYFDGHKLSREGLLPIMNLAIDIAANGSEVGACFKAAKRMSDLMDVMAVGSLAVLRAEEVLTRKKGGKTKNRKPGPRGENLDIWSMKLPER